jgi:hypothetical protein
VDNHFLNFLRRKWSMGAHTDSATWTESIYQIDVTTPASGGFDGPLNAATAQLADRTAFLRQFADEVLEARGGEASLLGRIEKRGVEPQDILSRYQYISDEPVAASTGNIDVVTGHTQTIDGIACVIGNLVFLKDQTNPVENGFWEVQSGAWNRYAGYTAANADCFTYKFIAINKGAANAGLIFFLDTDRYTIGKDNLNFKESIFTCWQRPGKVAIRDKNGRIEDITLLSKTMITHGDEVDGAGRNLFDVLGVSGVQEAIAALSIRCNGTGIPDFSGLLVGDYIDGIDLSAIPAENSGDAGQVWSSTYKNNRIVLSGFNTYKGFRSAEVTKNHLLFTFRNIPLKKRMNPTSDNTGGYIASELRAFLEGVSGNGSGDYSGSTTVTTAAFMNALNAQLGAGHLLTINKAHSIKSSYAWANYTVFPPSELEVCGYPTYGDEGVYMPALTSPVLPARVGYVTNVQFPIFSKSGEYRIKRYNGSRMWWWEQTPYSASASSFCSILYNGYTTTTSASSVGGCAPAFCVV